MEHSRLVRVAAVLALVLHLALGVVLLTGPAESTAARVMLVALVVVGVPMAARLWLVGCVECRLISAITGLLVAGGTLLTVTVGLPGAEARAVAPLHLALLAVGLAVPAILLAVALAGEPVAPGTSTYAP